jgi:hypothetical protein
MKCQEGRICAHWAEKNLQHNRKKILLEAWATICQLVGSLLEKILVKTMEDWKIVENFIFYSISNKTSQYYANSIDKVKIIRFVWNERKNENCQNIQFLCKIQLENLWKQNVSTQYPENKAQKMLSHFEDFITLCSALHFAYWW